MSANLVAIARVAHRALHIIDDAEELADGSAELTISAADWEELNHLLDQISDDPHETLHDVIEGNAT